MSQMSVQESCFWGATPALRERNIKGGREEEKGITPLARDYASVLNPGEGLFPFDLPSGNLLGP